MAFFHVRISGHFAASLHFSCLFVESATVFAFVNVETKDISCFLQVKKRVMLKLMRIIFDKELNGLVVWTSDQDTARILYSGQTGRRAK